MIGDDPRAQRAIGNLQQAQEQQNQEDDTAWDEKAVARAKEVQSKAETAGVTAELLAAVYVEREVQLLRRVLQKK
ncbi:MAG TPA: hypothetical protein VGG39_24970 [Polyangiaceae bacterium]|jgi:hypothetical protein